MPSRATYALLVLAAAGAPFACGMPGTGACGLEVHAEAHQERLSLDAPYGMTLEPPEAEAFQAIVPIGSGWRFVDVQVIGPDGSLVDDYRGPGDMINGGMVAFPIDAPGVWHFQVSDAQARCQRAFEVFVLPPDSS